MMYGLFRIVWDDGEDCFVSHFILMMDKNNEMTEDSKNRLNKYFNGNGEILKTEFEGYVTKNEMTTQIVGDDHIKEGWDCVKDRFYNMYFYV